MDKSFSISINTREIMTGIRVLHVLNGMMLGVLAVGAVMLSSSALRAQAVVIDSWEAAQNIETPAAGGAVDFNASNTASASAIGGFRKTWVEETADPNDFRLRSQVSGTTRILSHSEDSGVDGFSVLMWDGSSSVPTGPNDIDPSGLGGIDLVSSCPDGAPQSISFTITGAQENPVDITLEMYSDASNWSVASKTNPAATAQALTFLFSSDFATGTGATGPATFDNIGAIRLILDPQGESTQFDIVTPIVACGIDFADAPQLGFQGGTYTTTADLKADTSGSTGIKNNNRRGPHHSIGGPWFPAITAVLGAPGANGTDSESNGQPNGAASGDDNAGNDEQGVSLPVMPRGDTEIDPNLDPVSCDGLQVGDSEYCAAVRVANPLGIDSQVVGWVDFDGNGVFDNNCSTTDGAVVTSVFPSASPVSGCERSSAEVRIGDTGLVNFGSSCSAASLTVGQTLGGADFTTGNLPANCEGVVVLVWDLSGATDVTTDATYSRFRVTSSSLRGFFGGTSPITGAPNSPAPFGYQRDGEVEDHLLDAGTLPVSIHSFDSHFGPDGLVIEWGTVSETRNAGFYIWADHGDGMELLVEDMIPSTAIDPLQPQRYQHLIPNLTPGDIKELAITAVDYSGTEEMYGLFKAGYRYGDTVQPAPIAWDRIDQDVKSRMLEHVALKKHNARQELNDKHSPGEQRSSIAGMRADLEVRAAGLHRVTWQDLADAGLDLTGAESNDIAVTLDGKPVSRHILRRSSDETRSPAQRFAMRSARDPGGTPEFFGPGAEIVFWAEKPGLPDKLYVDNYVYRIEVAPSKAVNAGARLERGKPGPGTFMARLHRDEDVAYQFATPLDDPWYAAWLRADGSNSYTTTFEVDDLLVSGQSGDLTVVVGGVTSFDANPDHRIRVEVNGTALTDVYFDGSAKKSLQMTVPPGVLLPGNNTVRIVAPGGTAAPFDISLVDTVTLKYPRLLQASGNKILVEDFPDSGGLTIDGFTTMDTVAYAWDGSELIELRRHQFGRGSVRVPTIAERRYDYWISSVDTVLRPESIAVSTPRDLLTGRNANLIVVGHPAFLPVSANESHPLNDYVASREAEGWNVELFDILDIQREYSNGMPLPGALTRFLRAADRRFNYDHVLLVGGDSYDYTDNLGLGSVSFIPTIYAATSNIRHTPSDSLLADIDGDGVSDKALGRWPVRSISDLQSIVTKTLDWSGDLEALSNAVWLADSQDSAQPSFRAQVNRMADLLSANGWIDDEIAAIYFDDVSPNSGMSIADTARESFFDRLEQGRSISGFVGHGAPAMWTFQGLLAPDDLADLYNEGNPTLIGTLTCYTTYFVSPYSDTVAHRWMNGYREDAGGNPIPGVPNGAVAVHGAATLSDYAQNEQIAKAVLQRQLAGSTLGAAILQVRSESAGGSLRDQVINWTLLGDPTLMLD